MLSHVLSAHFIYTDATCNKNVQSLNRKYTRLVFNTTLSNASDFFLQNKPHLVIIICQEKKLYLHMIDRYQAYIHELKVIDIPWTNDIHKK